MKQSLGIPAPAFNHDDVEVTAQEMVYRGFFRIEKLTLRHRLFAGGWNPPFTRELFECGHAVGVLLYDPVHDLIGLVEQFRVGALAEQSPWCLEVVAGMLKEGETPEDVARRELVEEAGIEVDILEPICHYLPSPGGTNETMHLFYAQCNLQDKGGLFGLDSEHEDIRFHIIPAESALTDVFSGRFSNAAALICLLWLQVHRQRLRQAR